MTITRAVIQHEKIGYFVRLRLEAGDSMEAAVQEAMDRFGKSRRTVFSAWETTQRGNAVSLIAKMVVTVGEDETLRCMFLADCRGDEVPLATALQKVAMTEANAKTD